MKTLNSKLKTNNPVIKYLYIAGGTLSLSLALLGIFLPGLPVTPLALLAGWLYARSSDRLYQKLLDNKYLGPKIRDYKAKGGISRRGKTIIILTMTAMVLISAFLFAPSLWVRYLILSLGLIGGLVVWFWVPTVSA